MKPSVGAKSLPAQKPVSKASEISHKPFISTNEPSRSVAGKQGSLFGWMNNKKNWLLY